MADPTKPDIDYSYEGFQTEQQINPFPGHQLDNDLAELKRGVDDTIDALKDVRRSDGALKNGIVTRDSLGADVAAVTDAMNPDVYDPTGIAGDAFGMDNMVEGATTKILTADERTKLAGIEDGATADQTGAEIKALYEAEADTNAYTDIEKTKLAGVANGATANASDATLLARANHTGTQAIATVSGLQTALDGKQPLSIALADTRTALKAVDTSVIKFAYLKESGREGHFLWLDGDYSSRITADTAGGIYVKADAVPSSSGAWVRIVLDSVWRLRWFGIVPEVSSGPAYDTEIAAMCALGEIDKPTAYQFEDGLYNLDQVWPEANFQIGYWGVHSGGSTNTILNWRGIDATGRGVIHGSTWGYIARQIMIRSTEASASAYAGFSHKTPAAARNGKLYIYGCEVSLGDKVTHSFAFDGTANNGPAPIGDRDIFMENCLIFGAADSCVYGASVMHLYGSNNNISAVGGTGGNALKIRGVVGAISDVVVFAGGNLGGAIDLDKLTRGDLQTGIQMTAVKNTADVSGVIVRSKSGAGSGVVLQHNWADDCYYDIDENYLDRAAAYVLSSVTDVTGDGTEYTVIPNTLGLDTVNYPMSKCYDTSTGKYTALVAGYHSIKARVSLLGLTSSHTAAVLKIQSFTSGGSAVSSGRRTLEINPYALSVSGRVTLALSADIYMLAGQYAQITIAVSGGTKVVDIRGSASGDNWTGFEAQLC